jgi:hypothetical protein
VVETTYTINTSHRGFLQYNGLYSDGMMGFANSFEVGSSADRRSYLFFQIPTLAPSQSIVAARLSLSAVGNKVSIAYPRTVTFWDVSAGVGNIYSAYWDIGSGVSYGSFNVAGNDAIWGITAYHVDLNAQGLANMNSSSGAFFWHWSNP